MDGIEYYVVGGVKYPEQRKPIWDDPLDMEIEIEDRVRGGLVYEFAVDGHYAHWHSFGEVLKAAWLLGERFYVPEECRYQYSQQELDLLEKVAKWKKDDSEK